MNKTDLRKVVAGAVLAGGSLGLLTAVNPSGPATATLPPARVEAPAKSASAARIGQAAARAVLAGVGIGSGTAEFRTQTALDALGAEVERQSDPSALQMAFRAYYNYKAAHPGKVSKPYLYYVDYGLENTTPRGYVFDMESLTVVDGPFMVAHGRGSASPSSAVPTRFSNRHNSNATSLGLYLAQETYNFRGKSGGKRYTSVGLRLAGLSGKYNSEARARGVVAHGAPYVTASRAGRSEGCPAMEQDRANRLLPKIANGGMVFLFSPLERTWMQEDRWAGVNQQTAGPTRG